MVAVEQVGSVDLSVEQTKAQIMAYLREHFKKEKQIDRNQFLYKTVSL
jgi:hypothetical protein